MQSKRAVKPALLHRPLPCFLGQGMVGVWIEDFKKVIRGTHG